MKQLKIIFLLAIACITLCACPRLSGHQVFTFVNKSDKKIACQQNLLSRVTDTDTLYHCRVGAPGIDSDSLFLFECQSFGGWESDLQGITYLQLLIMDNDTYVKYIY